MTNIPRFVQVFALGAWVGSIFYFSAAVAPGDFRVLSSADQAGALIVFTLGRLHLMGVVAALLISPRDDGACAVLQGPQSARTDRRDRNAGC